MRWNGGGNKGLGLVASQGLGACATVLGVVVGFFLAPSAASAAVHPGPSTFGPSNQPSFTEAQGLAVDQSTGDLLVVDGTANTVSRWSEDGTPSNFADLGTNVIDGVAGGADETPQGGLAFGQAAEVQIAVDNSGGVTDGNIYVPQAAAGVVDIFDADGSFLGQLTESSEGPFVEPCGIAVDEEGDFYVGDFSGKIHKYEPAANPPVNADNSANLAFAQNCTLAAGAGPTDGFIFAAKFNGSVSKLDATTGAEKYVVDAGPITTVTVDPATGHLYTAKGNKVDEYDASGATEATLVSSIAPGGEVFGIAVSETTGNVYVARIFSPTIQVWGPLITVPEPITKPATPVGTESATLNGEVNPNEAPLTECFFEWGETTAYGQVAPCEDPDFEEVGEGSTPVAVHADISGLEPGTEYHFQLRAANADNNPGETVPGGDETFLTLGPSLRAESASQVTASGAQIAGEVNPRGKATSFLVQYVTEAQFLINGFAEAETTSPQAVGSEASFKKVVQQLSGLDPRTAYRFRIAATNSDATSFGAGGKFTTFALPTTDLPDNRKYEMVSPTEKTGEVIAPEPNTDLGGSCSECLPGINVQTMPMQAAPDGESVLYLGQPFSAGLAAGPNEYVSERFPSGWSVASRSTPVTTGFYRAFSSDLSLGVLSQVNPALTPEAPTRGAEGFANLYLVDEAGSVEPLITTEPPNREPGNPSPDSFRAPYATANAGNSFAPEFSHVLFEANDALTEAIPGVAPAAPEVGAGECTLPTSCNLYEWVDGELRLINVLPGNTSASTSAVIGAGRLLAGTPQAEAANVDHAISEDGSRIFFSDEASGQAFVRVDGTETLEIPGPGLCKGSIVLAEDRVCFLTASVDGSVVLLSDGQLYELTEGPEAYVEGENLTEGEGGFQGILGASEDLSQIYFVATSDLTGAEENENGEEAQAGKLNLYSWDEGDASFIGVLLPGDNGFGISGRFGTWKAAPSNRVAQVSADGSFLAFMSLARLTGYDNRRSGGGQCRGSSSEACREVFLYAADSDELSCPSCNPSGQRPLGGANLTLLRPLGPPFRQPNNLSDEGEGRLFFESLDSLLPQDTNGGVQDLYEWEPEGVGTCEEVGGCISLISTGHGANDTMFLDSSASGNDVFFITREQLLLRDKDEQLDLYDARVGGGFEEAPVIPCKGEACPGPLPPPPTQPSSASSTFSGPGNPPQNKPAKCKKGFVKKKGKCVKKKKGKKNKGNARRSQGGSR